MHEVSSKNAYTLIYFRNLLITSNKLMLHSGVLANTCNNIAYTKFNFKMSTMMVKTNNR